MKRIPVYLSPPGPCPYLEGQVWQLENMRLESLSPVQYLDLINNGWRRFGHTAFRPACPSCYACQPIRVPVATFKPNRIQRRTMRKNSELITLKIQHPKLDTERVYLYVRHHEHHTYLRNWPEHDVQDACSSIMNFMMGPLAVQEWAFYKGEELVAIAYIDVLPDGLSGIYFYWAPEHHDLSLGRWICLSMIQEAGRLGLPYAYFGYYVGGCISMEYKGDFRPNQVLKAPGVWEDFKP